MASALPSCALILLLATTASAEDAGVIGEERVAMQTVVTGTRTEQRASEATVGTEVITRREIEASGARNLAELLQAHPGVELVQSFRGSGIRLQGLDPEYVLILIDGQRVGGRLGNSIDISRFSLQDVERIELIKGPGSVLYGSDAMGGVVNLVTRPAQRPKELEGRAGYGTLSNIDTRAMAGFKAQGYDARLAGAYRHNGGWDLNPDTPATSGSESSVIDTSLNANWRPTDEASLTLTTSYTRKDQFAIDESPGGAVFDRRFRDELVDVAGRANVRMTDAFSLQAYGHHSYFRDQLLQDQHQSRDLDQYQEAKERLTELGVQLNQRFGGRHLATLATEGLFELSESPRIDGGRNSRTRVALMLQDDTRLLDSPRVSVILGGRVDQDSRFGLNFSPRIAARADPAENVTLRASCGWGFRAPNFTELYLRFENPSIGYVVEGNPDLEPEKSRGYAFSADVRVSDRITLSGSVFRTDLTNLISVVTIRATSPDAPTRFTYGNVTSAWTQGGELATRLRVGRGVYLDLGYALTDARNRETKELLEGRSVHRGTMQLLGRYRPTGIDWSVRGVLLGARPFLFDLDGDGAFAQVWSPPYVAVDARVGWQLLDWLGVYVLGTNLANAGDAIYLPIAPRGVQAGVTARY